MKHLESFRFVLFHKAFVIHTYVSEVVAETVGLVRQVKSLEEERDPLEEQAATL